MMSARWRRLRPDALIVLAYLILPLLLYAGVTLGPRTMLPADNLFQWPPWLAAAAEFDATPPHNALIGDLIIQNYPWKRFTLSSLRGGEIPLWNPYLFAGAPFLANGQHSALYPFSVLYLVLPLAKAYGWFVLSQVWLAGVSMYVFGRILGMRRGGAALAGFVYQGAQFLVISAAVFPMIAAAVVWLPFLLGCIERVITTSLGPAETRHRALLWAAVGAVGLACQVLAGHAEFTYYTLLIMALFALWRIVAAWQGSRGAGEQGRESAPLPPRSPAPLRPLLWLSALFATGLLIAAVQLVPLFEVGRINFRVGSASFAEVRGWAYPPRHALALLLPNFYGNPTHHAVRDAFTGDSIPLELNYHGGLNPYGATTTSWGTKNYVEGAAYMGILPLLLAGVGLTAIFRRRGPVARRAHALFFAGLAGVSLAFIFGTPLYALLYYGLPFIDQLHTPFRWVFPLALAVAALAGFGVDELRITNDELRMKKAGEQGGRGAGERDDRDEFAQSRRDAEGRKYSLRLRGLALISSLVMVAGLVVVGGTLLSRVFFDSARPLVERLFHGLAGADYAFPSAELFYSYLYWQLLLFGGLLAASGAALLLLRRARWGIVFACGLIVLDLYAANAGFHSTVDPALLDYTPAAVRWLQEQPGEWRITTYDTTGVGTLNANTPWPQALADVRGYDSIIPKQFTDYMAAIEPQNGLPFNRIQPIGSAAALESPLLDALAVRYVISSGPIDLATYRLAWEGEGVRIYENLDAAPRAYTLPGAPAALTALPTAVLLAERTPATLVETRNNQVVVAATADAPATLVLADSAFPGWRAYVRPAGSGEEAEREVEIVRVLGNFRGVALEPGEWTVRFRYSPRSFWLGGLMSFMGSMALVFALVVWGWRRFYRAEHAATTTRSVAKNSAAPMVLSLFNKGIDFVFAAFYLRILGPAQAGSYATAIATAGIFEIVANYGLNILLIREVSQDRSQAGRFLFNSSLLRLLTATVALLPVAGFIWAGGRGPNPLSGAELMAIGLLMVGMIFSGLTLGVSGLFYVYEQAEVPAAMSTVTTLLKVGLGVAALLAGFGFVGLAAVSIVVNVITLAVLLVMAAGRFELHGPWTVDRPLLSSMLRLGFPLMLIHLLQTIFISIDVLLLRQLLPDGERVVGYYNSAWKWFNALQIIPSYFTLALFPIISRAIKQDMDAARRMYRLALKLMLLLALPTSALFTFAAFPLIGLLGGREFLPDGAIALRIIMWSIPFGWLNSVTNYVLIALGMERLQPRAFALAVGFNIVANILLIPRYSYVAAAVITVLSEVVLLVVFAYFLHRRGAGVDWLGLAGRPALLTGFMLAALWLGGQLHLIIGLALGIVVYLAGLFALRIIGPEERAALGEVLPGAVTRRLGW